jgi:8-oxo-dGTP diphosphatase
MRQWLVAGALIETTAGLLIVRNLRHHGGSDWSTPGGVIDASDASILEGLAREVEEETGLRVTRWEGPLYEVVCVAPDMEWTMRVEVHRALDFEGEVRVQDPDGIVVEAAWVPCPECLDRLSTAGAPWVAEPLGEWLAERWTPAERRDYRYHLHGTGIATLSVERLS